LSCSMVSGPSSDPLVLHDEVFSVDAHPPCLPASPPCPGDDDVVDMHVEHVVRPVQPVSFVEECIEVEPSSSHVFIALSAAMAEADESTHFVPTNKPEKEDLALINKFIKEFGEGGTKSTGKSRKKLKIEEGKHIKENRKDRAARKAKKEGKKGGGASDGDPDTEEHHRKRDKSKARGKAEKEERKQKQEQFDKKFGGDKKSGGDGEPEESSFAARRRERQEKKAAAAAAKADVANPMHEASSDDEMANPLHEEPEHEAPEPAAAPPAWMAGAQARTKKKKKAVAT